MGATSIMEQKNEIPGSIQGSFETAFPKVRELSRKEIRNALAGVGTPIN